MMGGEDEEEMGLVPRLGRAMLERIAAKERRVREEAASDGEGCDAAADDDEARFTLKATYVEIYNEKVYDLLSTVQDLTLQANCRVREHPKTGPYVEGAQQKEVSSWDDMKAFLEQGAKARRVAATNMNMESSRSHAIFTLEFRQSVVVGGSQVRRLRRCRR
jgi:hypothetical protein